jgi:hypothetical protein
MGELVYPILLACILYPCIILVLVAYLFFSIYNLKGSKFEVQTSASFG